MLYDLAKDEGEHDNVAAKNPDVVKRLATRFQEWSAQTVPPLWTSRLEILVPLQDILDGKPLDLAAIEDLDEDFSLGVGKVEDFTWKGLLDFTSCTECGRCQSQCPAWHTGKPLSPKLLIMDLREHAYAKAPYLQAAESARASPTRW